MGPEGYPRRGYRIHETLFQNLCLGFLRFTYLSLSKQDSRPVPSRNNIRNNVESPKLESELLNFLKSVQPSF